MITRRPADERGSTRTGWLDSWHTFSFNRYYDPRHMGFRDLRVINEDFVAPATGFGAHSHSDMEIITYIVSGALEHKDSMGNTSVIRPGDAQRMSAGTGVTHSEHNPSADTPTHLLQIWILPEREGLPPGYEQREFVSEGASGGLRLIASRTASDGAVKVHQDVEVYAATLGEGEEVAYELRSGRHAWVQLIKGSLRVNDVELRAGDGAAVSEEDRLLMRAVEPSEMLLFDLA